MPNLEILKNVSSLEAGNVVTDADVTVLGATPEDWIACKAAKRTDKECTKGLDLFRVPGTRENAERANPKAVKAYDERLAADTRALVSTK